MQKKTKTRAKKQTAVQAPTRDELIAQQVAHEVAKPSRIEFTVYCGSLTINVVATA